MQNYTTIIGIIDMRQRGISYDDCQTRYHIGSSTLQLIMKRFKEYGKTLDPLKQMPKGEVENLFYPPENIRRKDASVMPDYQEVYSRLTASGSKANLFYDAMPKHLVPDNLKAAITRHTRDELVLASAYQELESFYDVIILPPPPRKPTGYRRKNVISNSTADS